MKRIPFHKAIALEDLKRHESVLLEDRVGSDVWYSARKDEARHSLPKSGMAVIDAAKGSVVLVALWSDIRDYTAREMQKSNEDFITRYGGLIYETETQYKPRRK